MQKPGLLSRIEEVRARHWMGMIASAISASASVFSAFAGLLRLPGR